MERGIGVACAVRLVSAPVSTREVGRARLHGVRPTISGGTVAIYVNRDSAEAKSRSAPTWGM